MVVDKSKQKILILKGLRYILVFSTIMLLAFSAEAQQSLSADSTWWYQSGQKQTWYKQQDVFAYRSNTLTQLPLQGHDDVLLYQYFREKNIDKMNVVYFKPNSNPLDVELAKQSILNHASFNGTFPIITLNPDSQNTSGKWLLVDNLLMVKFRDSNLPTAWFNDFRTRYNLSWQNPEIKLQNTGANHVYIFSQNSISDSIPDVITLSRKIYQQDSSMVEQALPNKVMAFQPVINDTNNEVVLSFNEEDIEGKDYYISANGNDILKVYFNDRNTQVKKTFKIYDSLGQLILAKPLLYFENSDFYIRTNDFPLGMYYTLVEEENGNLLHFQKYRKL